jgi:hypothetical protein
LPKLVICPNDDPLESPQHANMNLSLHMVQCLLQESEEILRRLDSCRINGANAEIGAQLGATYPEPFRLALSEAREAFDNDVRQAKK